MKRKTATKILSFIIVSSFFLPLFEWHGFEMTGLNYILSTQIPSYKYFLLLAPLSGLLIFFDTLDDRSFFFNSKIFSWIPIVSLVFVCVMRLLNGNAENSFYDNETYFSTINFGFWIMLIFSILLVVVKDSKRLFYQYEKNESDFFH
ncbi:MAG TPA: hypothetical protein VGQ04_20515 [Chitinophagaceae bacterium]|nr:hypothetical protein [Chitinophagaceae bacterium]